MTDTPEPTHETTPENRMKPGEWAQIKKTIEELTDLLGEDGIAELNEAISQIEAAEQAGRLGFKKMLEDRHPQILESIRSSFLESEKAVASGEHVIVFEAVRDTDEEHGFFFGYGTRDLVLKLGGLANKLDELERDPSGWDEVHRMVETEALRRMVEGDKP